MQILLHDATRKAVDDFLQSPGHSLLISGPLGSGKGTVAAHIVASLLNIEPHKLTEHPYTLWLREHASVSIEDIRAIQKLMQLKVPGSHSIRRAVIVEHTETMSHEAQNAFLKLLEEPPKDTLLVLTVANVHQLLPTILSRVQHIRILAPSQQALREYYHSTNTSTDIDRAYYLSEGYMGLAHAILQDDTEHPLMQQIQSAKTLLSGTTFDRLAAIDEITKQKNVPVFLQAMERVCHAALTQSALKNSPATKAWKQRLQAVVNARNNLRYSPQAKLLLTDLFLNL